jgi:hypothetical protein
MLGFAAHALAVIVRSNAAPDLLMHSTRELTAFDSGAIIQNPEPLTDLIRSSLAQQRFSLIVPGAFAAMALVLALVGIYGVISRSLFEILTNSESILRQPERRP